MHLSLSFYLDYRQPDELVRAMDTKKSGASAQTPQRICWGKAPGRRKRPHHPSSTTPVPTFIPPPTSRATTSPSPPHWHPGWLQQRQADSYHCWLSKYLQDY